MSKPLPTPNVVTRNFWSKCQEGQLDIQVCNKCGHKQFPPRLTCVGCHSSELEWQHSNGQGTVFSFTVVYRAPVEAFKEDTPYVIAIIALDEGVSAMMNLREVEPDAVTIGMRVEVFFEFGEGEYLLPQARPKKAYLFDTFEPGELLGCRNLLLERNLVEQWLTLFPEDQNGDFMPPGMMAAVYSRAYSSILQPRPPGNVHGEQVFTVNRIPRIGDELVTELFCEGKEMKNKRRWIRFASETRNLNGELMFTGLMTTMWAK